MNPDDVPVKTEKGLEELQTRALRLSSKFRQLLIMIDGRKSVHVLLKDYKQMDGVVEILDELLRLNLIAFPNKTASSRRKIAGELADSPLEPHDAAKQYLMEFVHSLFGDDNAALINQIQSCTQRDEFMDVVNECREMVVGIAGKKKADEFVAGILALLPD